MGRPRKPVEVLTLRDVSLDQLEAYAGDIEQILTAEPFAPYFQRVRGEVRVQLVRKLAKEVTYLPTLCAYVQSKKMDRRGPKPKADHTAFVATVRDALVANEVHLPQWANQFGSRNDLADFCMGIARLAGITLSMSQRTAKKLPPKGFTPDV